MKKESISVILVLCLALLSTSAYGMSAIEAKALSTAAFENNFGALNQLIDAAETGNSFARFWLGTYYSNEKYLKSAESGNANGELNIGCGYFVGGMGIPKNPAQSVYWLTKSAKQGNAEAESLLGSAYSRGRGVQQNMMTAIYWWKKASNIFSYDVCSIGFAYQKGEGVPKNYARANAWFRKDDSSGPCADGLGDAYMLGLGVPENYTKADYWYHKGARMDCQAALSLGAAYYEGLGVPQNTKTAIYWWKTVVKNGVRKLVIQAQNNINIAKRATP